jgi:2-iminobutanoate/2-iminopropanoate deaminase
MTPPHLAPWTRAGSTIYLSGQLAFGQAGRLQGDGVAEQTTQTLQNIRTILDTLGLAAVDIVKTTVWLRDRADFPAFNEAYAAFFGEHRPARSTVVSDLVLPEARVEIEVVAIDPQSA